MIPIKNFNPLPLRLSPLSALVFSLVAAWVCLPVSASDEFSHGKRPNIVFILTDDQGPWAIGASGMSQAKTPRIDRLAAEGARFTNAFTPTPVCSPARASILTSRYGSELGITDWINPTSDAGVGLDATIPTWPRMLQQAGYSTALFGKWHLGDTDEQHPTRRGYETFVGFRGGGTTPRDPMLEHGFLLKQRTGFIVDIVTDEAIAWLRQRDSSSPFAVSIHYREPHAAYLPVPDQDWERVRDLDINVPDPQIPGLQTERVKKLMREYLASVAAIDRNVGRLLDTLDDLKLSSETIVIFTSDHGYNLGHHGLLYKGNAQWMLEPGAIPPGSERIPRGQRPNMFDTSLRVPLVIRWPKVIEAGRVEHRTVSHLDWTPTFAALIGDALNSNSKAREPEARGELGDSSREKTSPSGRFAWRGRNLLPLLRGNAVNWDNDFYAEYSMKHGARADMRMYRTSEWKLVRDFGNAGRDELYHLASDPGETRNRIDDKADALQQVRQALEEKIAAKMAEINDPIRPKREQGGGRP